MDDFTNIFDPLDSQTASDEDQGLATAGEILVKLAEEEGIDLDQLSETELLGLVNTLRGDGTTNLNDPEPRKEASQTMYENQITEAQFDALVMQETAKVAAANELDISSLSIEDLTELRAAVEEEIAADPDAYFAKTAAEEEFQAKVAEADYMGRLMAHSFADELGLKVADDSAAYQQRLKEMASRKEPKAPKPLRSSAAALKRQEAAVKHMGSSKTVSKELAERGAAYGKNMAYSTRLDNAVRSLGRKIPGVGRHTVGGQRLRGYGALGAGAAALGAAGYGAKRLMDKESTLDDLAMQRAAEFLASQGFDPATGEKVAASEAEIDEAINLRALEILEERGWTFGE